MAFAHAKAALSASGVEFPDGASAVFNPVTSQLIVKNTIKNLERVRKIVEKKAAPVTWAYLTSKVVVFDEKMLGRGAEIADFLVSFSNDPSPKRASFQQMEKEATAAGGKVAQSWPAVQLTAPQFQAVIRLIAEPKSAGINISAGAQEALSHAKQLFSLPSVTTKSDQKAKVEVIREFIYPTEYGPSPQDGGAFTPVAFGLKLLGATIDLDPSIHDDASTIDLDYTVTFAGLVEMREFKADSGDKLSVPAFQTNVSTSSASLPSGGTVAFVMSEAAITDALSGATKGVDSVKSHSRPVIVFITAALIDPTGQQPKNAAKTGPQQKVPLIAPAADSTTR